MSPFLRINLTSKNANSRNHFFDSFAQVNWNMSRETAAAFGWKLVFGSRPRSVLFVKQWPLLVARMHRLVRQIHIHCDVCGVGLVSFVFRARIHHRFWGSIVQRLVPKENMNDFLAVHKHMHCSNINGGTPKSSIFNGKFSLNHPFWGTPPFMETSPPFHS